MLIMIANRNSAGFSSPLPVSRLIVAAVFFSLLASATRLDAAGVNLIPTTPGTAPDYFCTWNIQGYVVSYDSGQAQRNAMVESNLFGAGKYQNWLGFYPR